MGFRFSRRIKLAPGLRLNIGLKSLSLSTGVRGANLTLGKGGLHGNVGLPGTGLSYRTRLLGGPSRVGRGGSGRGAALAALRAEAEALNTALAHALDVHLLTPPPAPPADAAFAEPKPTLRRDREIYMTELAGWRARRAAHESGRWPAPPWSRMSEVLTHRFAALSWPRETTLGFEAADGGRTLRLDVDLPEIEDLPSADLFVDAAAVILAERPIGAAALRRRYARHVHGVLFRLVGEAFATEPAFDRVEAAGFSQRLSGATGRIEDAYLLHVAVDRATWGRIDFAGLKAVDPVVALSAFALRRDMTRGVELRTIEPPAWGGS